MYEVLADVVVPTLWKVNTGALHVWSAGCSSGEEPYSLAVLFHRYGQCTIISRALPGSMCSARTSIAQASPWPSAVRCGGAFRRHRAARTISAKLRPSRSSLRSDGSCALNDGICWRSSRRCPAAFSSSAVELLIYFDPKRRATADAFHEASRRAALVLGKVETLLGPVRSRFLRSMRASASSSHDRRRSHDRDPRQGCRLRRSRDEQTLITIGPRSCVAIAL